jgi:CheY-like chemotaxis protein
MTSHMRAFLDEGRKLRQEMRKHGYFLIVEDSPETVGLFRAIFSKCRTKLRAVGNVDDALALVEAEPNDIQCVIIDLHVPDSKNVGGYRLVEYLENNRTGIPYVVHSGDEALANKVVKKFPRASVLFKGAALTDIRNLLGLAYEGEVKNKD